MELAGATMFLKTVANLVCHASIIDTHLKPKAQKCLTLYLFKNTKLLPARLRVVTDL